MASRRVAALRGTAQQEVSEPPQRSTRQAGTTPGQGATGRRGAHAAEEGREARGALHPDGESGSWVTSSRSSYGGGRAPDSSPERVSRPSNASQWGLSHEEKPQARFSPSSRDYTGTEPPVPLERKTQPPSSTRLALQQPGARSPISWISESEERYDSKPAMYKKEEAPATQTSLALQQPGGNQPWTSEGRSRFAAPAAGSPAPERVKRDSNKAQWNLSHEGAGESQFSTTSRSTFSGAAGDAHTTARGGVGRESSQEASPQRSGRHAVSGRRDAGFNIITNQ